MRTPCSKVTFATLVLLGFVFPVCAQREDFKRDLPIGRIVVLRLPAELLPFENVGIWTGRMNFSARIEQLPSGELIVGGRGDWKSIGSPLLAEMILVKATRKKDYTEVELRNLFVNIKLRFSSNISDLARALNEIVFTGTLAQRLGDDVRQSSIPKGSAAREIGVEVAKSDVRVEEIIERANDHFQKGKLNLENGKRESARDEFDKAVDVILMSGLDVRASQRLQGFYLELVERIYREETPLIQVPANRNSSPVVAQGPAETKTVEIARAREGKIGFVDQGFEPSALDPLSKLILTEEERASSTTMLSALKNRKLSGQTCNVDKARAARLRGFYLGMTVTEVKVRVPTLRIPLANTIGYSLATIQFGLKNRPPAQMKDIREAIFAFLDGRLAHVGITYDGSLKWKDLDEFVAHVSTALGVPGSWEVTSAAGSEQRTLQCGTVRFMAKFRYSTLEKHPFLYVSDDAAADEFESRSNSLVEKRVREAEERQRKKAEEEEKRRKAFKP